MSQCLIREALRLAVRNAESRLHHAAPLGASYGQPERASLAAELERYKAGLEALETATPEAAADRLEAAAESLIEITDDLSNAGRDAEARPYSGLVNLCLWLRKEFREMREAGTLAESVR